MQLHCPTLTLYTHGGLGNRIFPILSALRLYDQVKYSIKLHWYPDNTNQSSLSDLFQLPSDIALNGPSGTSDYVTYTVHDGLAAFEVLEPRSGSISTMRGLLHPEDLQQRHARQIRYQIVDAFEKHFKLSTIVQDRLQTLPPFTDVVGVHCRRSDYPMIWFNWQPRYSIKVLRAYERRLNAQFTEYLDTILDDNQQIFLASDSRQTIEYFLNKYGDRVICNPKTNYPKTICELRADWYESLNQQSPTHVNFCNIERPLESVLDSMIDLVLLSRCQKLVADSNSTFSLTAHYMGYGELIRWPRPKIVGI